MDEVGSTNLGYEVFVAVMDGDEGCVMVLLNQMTGHELGALAVAARRVQRLAMAALGEAHKVEEQGWQAVSVAGVT